MIGIVIVSHSAALAAGVVELARGTAGNDIKIAAAGGLDMPKSPLGTDAILVLRAIEEVYSDEGVLIFVDMGSAILSAEFAMDMLPPERRANVTLCTAPIVEGAVTAALQVCLGQTLTEVVNEAHGALKAKCACVDTPDLPANVSATEPQEVKVDYEISLTIHNSHGLHARPAARLLKTASQFQAQVQLTNLTTGYGPVSTKSINDLIMLNILQGHRLRVCTSGPQAREALDALQALAATNFGDGDGTAGGVTVKPDMPETAERPDTETEPKIPVTDASKSNLQGIPISRGIAIGPARLLRVSMPDIPRNPASDPQAEWERTVAALDETQLQIKRECKGISPPADRELFDAHLLLLQDDSLRTSVRREIFESGHNGALAWHQTMEETAVKYASLGNEYLQARAADVREVARRVLLNMLGDEATGPALNKEGIIIAAELGLGDIARIDTKVVRGICIGQGGATSHSAILISNIGIPAVIGLGDRISVIEEGATVIVDGDNGIVIVQPPAEVLDDYRKRLETQRTEHDNAMRESLATAFTLDGRRVEVAANIGSTAEATASVANGAEGVGLYRSEFLFLARNDAPGEEEQYSAYREAATALENRPLIFRTLDIGGDKVLPYITLDEEENPFLGVRGLRLSLAHRDLFKTQLRAILRTAAEFPVRIMFPMVTTLAEWKEATALLSEARSEVAERGLLLPPKIETGIMIEVPGAALQAEKFARVVDFFSIGSNDLTQYTLATERGNPSVATLFDSLHPAVLRLVQNVVQAAHSHGKWVGICGEIAGDAVAVPLLIGLGLDELSMNVAGIPHIKQIIRTLNFPDLQVLAETSLTLESADEVRKLLKAFNSKNSEPQ